ncbi:MAG: hypothetical protein K8T20_04090 [Planctomycetes bacterium]|nr:hypothetical protein [Planctomycetota bacterium]
MFQLSRELNEHQEIHRAYLVLKNPGMSLGRQNGEWGAGLDLLRPALAARLALIRVEEAGTCVVPEVPENRAAADALLPLISEAPASSGHHKPLGAPRSFFDVLKILTHAWLLHEGALAIREIEGRTMLSYPSVAAAVNRLEARREIQRGTDRSVVLTEFPRQSWAELVANADSYRRTSWYADSAGRAPEPDYLLQLLGQRPFPGVAVGGVAAARHWQPDFDLVGMPRLDLVVSTSVAPTPSEIAKSLDPALVPATKSTNVAIAIHDLLRPVDLFVRSDRYRVPVADPVETLLDLYDLRLVDQAERFIMQMRAKATHALA